jgi:hypothetical protein
MHPKVRDQVQKTVWFVTETRILDWAQRRTRTDLCVCHKELARWFNVPSEATKIWVTYSNDLAARPTESYLFRISNNGDYPSSLRLRNPLTRRYASTAATHACRQFLLQRLGQNKGWIAVEYEDG